jgi:hypothetical protein
LNYLLEILLELLWSHYKRACEALNGLEAGKVNHFRHLNVAAHSLAKEALSLSLEYGLIKEVPLCIFDIIYVERHA